MHSLSKDLYRFNQYLHTEFISYPELISHARKINQKRDT